MKTLSNVLTVVICLVIAVAFFVVMSKLKSIKKSLVDLNSEIEKNSYSTKTESLESGVDPINRVQQTRQSTVTTMDYDAVNKDRDRYNRYAAQYLSNTQLISIFPLAGLFGTVIGILLGMTGDASSLYASLGTALWTTFAGLVAAIVLKWYDAVEMTTVIQSIEYQFETKDREYQNIIAREKYIEAGR